MGISFKLWILPDKYWNNLFRKQTFPGKKFHPFFDTLEYTIKIFYQAGVRTMSNNLDMHKFWKFFKVCPFLVSMQIFFFLLQL